LSIGKLIRLERLIRLGRLIRLNFNTLTNPSVQRHLTIFNYRYLSVFPFGGKGRKTKKHVGKNCPKPFLWRENWFDVTNQINLPNRINRPNRPNRFNRINPLT